jgi:hypothetical protein
MNGASAAYRAVNYHDGFLKRSKYGERGQKLTYSTLAEPADPVFQAAITERLNYISDHPPELYASPQSVFPYGGNLALKVAQIDSSSKKFI